MKNNEKPTTQKQVNEKVFIPRTESELREWTNEGDITKSHKWLNHVREIALKVQPDLNKNSLEMVVSGVIGFAIHEINKTNPNKKDLHDIIN